VDLIESESAETFRFPSLENVQQTGGSHLGYWLLLFNFELTSAAEEGKAGTSPVGHGAVLPFPKKGL